MSKKMEDIFSKIAQEHGVTPEEVQRDMAAAIAMAYANPADEQVAQQQAQVPREGDVPTPEELVKYALEKLQDS